MIFAAVPIESAMGAILAHGIKGEGLALAKGRKLTSDDLLSLSRAGYRTVVVARMEAEDIPEDEAAATIAASLAGAGVSVTPAATGRANLHAAAKGLAVIDVDRLHRMNAIDEAITIATVPAFAVVEPGQMLATIKIIPFAAPDRAVSACRGIAMEAAPPLSVAHVSRAPGGTRSDAVTGNEGQRPGEDDRRHAGTARGIGKRARRNHPRRSRFMRGSRSCRAAARAWS